MKERMLYTSFKDNVIYDSFKANVIYDTFKVNVIYDSFKVNVIYDSFKVNAIYDSFKRTRPDLIFKISPSFSYTLHCGHKTMRKRKTKTTRRRQTLTHKIPERKGHVLYMDALSTFYLRLYYMASDIWYRTIQIAKEETRCSHMGHSLRIAASVLL